MGFIKDLIDTNGTITVTRLLIVTNDDLEHKYGYLVNATGKEVTIKAESYLGYRERTYGSHEKA